MIGLLLIGPLVSLRAGSLEFRSDGFFASPDTQLKFFRETWRTDSHFDLNGKFAVNFVGPILQPGYNTLAAAETATEIDPARRQIVESGVIGKLATPCRRTLTEYNGGMLIRLEYGPANNAITGATTRFIFPIDLFANRHVRWTGGETTFPAAKPDADHFDFVNDSKGEANQFRFDLGNGTELGVKFLSPLKGVVLSDCRQWNEPNYHLQATFDGNTMLVFVCLLKLDEPFPPVEAPKPEASPDFQASDAATHVQFLDGAYDVTVTKSGQIQARTKGGPLLHIDSPFVDESGTRLSATEPVKFDVKDNRIEVVTKVKDKPYSAHQTISIDGAGWLDDSVSFEGTSDLGTSGKVEASLPTDIFAGQTLRAGDRYIDLPKAPSVTETLFNDWNASVLDYELPPDGQNHVSLISDAKSKTLVNDYRKYNQTDFKIQMSSRENKIKYRLHFWKCDGKGTADAKGNLLSSGASFETGPEGVQSYSCHSWNEKMVGPGVPPVFDTSTAVDGTTSLRLTASDPVKLGNRAGFSFVGAAFNRVPLKRDHVYTLSAWMKADRPGIKATLYCGETTWSGEDWDAFPVTTEWNRYHVTFFTADFKKSAYFLTWAGMAQECKEGSLWIDAVQLEEGGLSDFQPARQVEYGVETNSVNKLFENGGTCGATLHVRNNGKTPLTEKVTFAIKDYWENVVRSGEIPVNVPPESTISYPVDLGKFPSGYYRGYFYAPGDVTREIIFGSYAPLPLTPLPDDWPLACHNDPSPLVRKLGFGSVRAFECFQFSSIAPEKDRFDFFRSDRMVDEAEKSGLTIMPILGEFRWPSYQAEPSIPAYAADSTVENKVGGDSVRLTWPKMEAWKDYVRALTSHYKGRITCWEVLNEPNLEMTAKQYVPYLQAAYEAAKEGNPDCKIVGVCATSDATGKPDDFTQGVLDLGGAQYFDILSVHLYHPSAPEETLGIGSDKLIQKWRETLKEKYGKETSVWNTEKSYSSRELGYSSQKNFVPAEYCDEPQFLIDTFKHKAEYLIRETLLDAVAGGSGRFYWFGVFDDDASFITVRSFQPYGLNHTEFDNSPDPELIAANGLARALEGMSHPFKQLSLGASACASVFTGDKGTLVALWGWKKKGRLLIPAGATQPILRNFFGEPIPTTADAQGRIAVDLESTPKYLSFPGTKPDAVCALLEKASEE